MKKILMLLMVFLLVACEATPTPNMKNNTTDKASNTENISNDEVEEVLTDNEITENQTYTMTLVEVIPEQQNVYQSTDNNAEVIGSTYRNDDFLLIEQVDENWLAIDYFGQTGYIPSSSVYIFKITDYLTSDELEHAFIKVSALNVRDGHSENDLIIDKVYQGEFYPILEKKLDESNRIWYFIELEFGNYGWVAGWYCGRRKNNDHHKHLLTHYDTDTQQAITDFLMKDFKDIDELLKYDSDYDVTGNTVNGFGLFTYYDFKNGLTTYADTLYPDQLARYNLKEFRLFGNPRVQLDYHDTPGKEMILVLSDEIILYDNQMNIISNHSLRTVFDTIKLLDINGDGVKELILSNDKSDQIYRIKDGTFEQMSFYEMKKNSLDHIHVSLDDATLNIEDQYNKKSFEGPLPARMLLMSELTDDSNRLIFTEPFFKYSDTGQFEITTDILIATSYPNRFLAEHEEDYQHSIKFPLGSVKHAYDPSSLDIVETKVSFKYDEKDAEKALFSLNDLFIKIDDVTYLTSSNTANEFKAIIQPNFIDEDDYLKVYKNKDLFYASHDSLPFYQSIRLLTDTYETYKGLKVGMNRETVLDLLGTPDEETSSHLIYYTVSDHNQLLNKGFLWHSRLNITLDDQKIIQINIESQSSDN